jgi:FAD:protein FMN transferase
MERLLRPKWLFACAFVIILIAVLINRRPAKIISINGKTMGTTYHVKYLDNGHGIKTLTISNDLNKILKNINQEMSTYIKDSNISLFNKSTSLQWQSIPADFFRVLEHALDVAKKTNGIFDPTIGPLVNIWGFGPDGNRQVPSTELIELTKKRVGYHYIELKKSPFMIKKSNPSVYLDLSASAKGFGVDTVSLHLRKLGLENHMVEIGGEVRAAGTKNGEAWRIGIESPGQSFKMAKKIVQLKNKALATSGSYRNYFNSKGIKYSHAIDFKTGKPVEHSLASVSVISAKGCMDADSWATAFMVMGPVKGLKLAKKLKMAVFFIYKKAAQDDKDFIEAMTPEFKLHLKSI